MTGIFVGLGSNIEEPIAQLGTAYRRLREHPLLEASTTSSVYVSSPQGPKDQPDFFNAVVQIHTVLEPMALLDVLLEIEQQMGRVRVRHWGERCIDLDLLLYDTVILHSARLQLPHPRAHERRFVLDPLIELLGPAYTLPGEGPLGQLQSRCSEQGIRVWCEFPK